MPHSEAHTFCQQMLPRVSRTFAINIEVLRGEIYRAVLCGYLFCRIIDTVEDSHTLPTDVQEHLLDQFVNLLSKPGCDPKAIQKWIEPFQSLDAAHPDILLVQNTALVIENFSALSPRSQHTIMDCVSEMAQGMKHTISQKRENPEGLHTLRSIDDLDTYCYYVAGTVGKLLTGLFIEYGPSITPTQKQFLEERQVSFGLGLQVTNIIKDCFEDYQRRWCYLPTDLMARHGVSAEEFFEPKNNDQAMAVLEDLIQKAAGHLDDALDYTLTFPRRACRLRLFCLWPLFFAIRTLGVATGNRNLVTGHAPVKITRKDVRQTLLETTALIGSNTLLRKRYQTLRQGLDSVEFSILR